jgi:hypothetical protein
MANLRQIEKDRNYIKFRLKGAYTIINLPVNALTYEERVAIAKATLILKSIIERYDYTSQILGIKKKK